MELIQRGVELGIIKFNEDKTRIYYIHPNKNYSYKDPEEKVRAETYCQLVIDFNYKPERFGLEVIMPARVPNNIADIVIYNDDDKKDPFIVVECKKSEVTEAEFIQAIEQGFGNAVTLAAHYLWVTSGLNDRYFNVKDFPSGEREANEIPLIPVFGKKEFNEPTFIKGGEGLRALKTLTESELTQLFKKAHDSLWYGGKRNPSEAFDELNKLIFCKIYDEKLTDEDLEDGEPYRFQNYPSDAGNAKTLFDRINSIYDDGRKQDPEVFKDGIRITPSELRTIVGFLAKVNLVDTDLDSKGRAFEVFLKNDIFRGKFGQYFTPRNIVKFIVDVLPIDGKSLVLDPSCGSGGFLLYALDRVRQLANKKFPKPTQAVKRYNYWHDFAEKNLFGIEISETIARTSKMNMIIHDDGHTNVIAHDGLENIQKIREHARKNKSREYRKFEENTFDFIITNPPFGSKVLSSERAYIGDYDLGKKNYDWIDALLKGQTPDKNRDSQKSEILFIEQCYKFLKNDTGILAMVIPDGILTNSTQQYVRDWISEHFQLLAVISLPQTAFQATGAGVKSSVLFAKKYNAQKTQALQEKRLTLQTDLFGQAEHGAAIQKLLDEKKYVLKKGDAHIQQINDELANYVQSIRNQIQTRLQDDTLSKTVIKDIKKEYKDLERTEIKRVKENIKVYQKTEPFAEWKGKQNELFNEKIELAKEALDETYMEKVKVEFENYPIFMTLAEDIGYDATGKETNTNELEIIKPELEQFINLTLKGDSRQLNFFVSALA